LPAQPVNDKALPPGRSGVNQALIRPIFTDAQEQILGLIIAGAVFLHSADVQIAIHCLSGSAQLINALRREFRWLNNNKVSD
jgi:hypothetical protein